jgi:hypothetical protein
MVLRQGFKTAIAGTAAGAILSFAADRLMTAAFGGNSHPLVAYFILIPSIFVATMLAAFIPRQARRACGSDDRAPAGVVHAEARNNYQRVSIGLLVSAVMFRIAQ